MKVSVFNEAGSESPPYLTFRFGIFSPSIFNLRSPICETLPISFRLREGIDKGGCHFCQKWPTYHPIFGLQYPYAQNSPLAGRAGRLGTLRCLRGGYVPETLVAPLEELAQEYEKARKDPA